jgi:hypothetical protein
VYAYTKLNAALRRETSVSLDHAVLHFDSTAHCIHNTAELNDASVTRALDHTSVVNGDGGVNQIATESPKPR